LAREKRKGRKEGTLLDAWGGPWKETRTLDYFRGWRSTGSDTLRGIIELEIRKGKDILEKIWGEKGLNLGSQRKKSPIV